MAEVEIRDSKIKLFGKTIALPLNHGSMNFPNEAFHCKFVSSSNKDEKEELVSERKGNEITDQTTSGVSENPSIEREISSPKASKNEEQSETSISPDDKTLKKPDKILPCPRCNSMDTKFCYFNNYNVNQPRHFCKNCQRYWTAGGTMRNVPIGAGRRKNKTSSSSSSSSSNFHHLIHPHEFLANNGTFLTFGSDSSNGDDHSSKSSITPSNSSEKGQQSVVKNVLPFPPQLQPFTGLPWSYSSIAPPRFGSPGFPVSYYPVPPYWSSTPPPSWTLINPNSQNPFPNSTVLGKRLRYGKIAKQSNCEEGLKVDDSNEAAKSSIWSTLGIKNNEKVAGRSINGSGLFGSFQQSSKGKEEDQTESCTLLQANPAAFSRAMKFREIA